MTGTGDHDDNNDDSNDELDDIYDDIISEHQAPGLAVRRGPGLPGRERRGGGRVPERV